MPRLQELIHALEVGSGARYLRVVALLLAVITIAIFYDLRELQNFRTEEAMDAAQVGRNIAEGRGFTTRYIRPLSMAVIRDHRPDRDPLIKGEHPDLANPPLYPLLIAGVMKIPGLFDHQIPSPKEGQFRRHQPDFLITVLNQAMLFLSIALTWFLARKLFEPKVGLLTALAMLGSEVLWQFSGSGLPTMLCLVLFMLLANILYGLSAGSRRDPIQGLGVAIVLAAIAGLLCAALCLTRYALGVMIIPVVVYLIASFPGRRAILPVVAGVVFLLAISPWLARNWQICGNPFGIAPYSLAQETSQFTDNWLTRSLDADVSKVGRDDIVRKSFLGASQVLREELPQLGGSWLTAFFLAGLLVPFVDRSRAQLRWFTVGALAALSLAQILSRTYLSTDLPRVNSENLLVLMTPMVAMFGMALVWLLVYSLDVFAEAWRSVVLGLVIAVLWFPLVVG
ncbi:MAG: glycosyltransferase family 39 protein, partial [Verrucomicrobiales bacterium]|nr:glycosyltransferase family 39 protein [Verrucomicrobiales bacterium]